MWDTKISASGIEILRGLIDSEFRQLSGWDLNHTLAADDVLISTSMGKVLLHAAEVLFEVDEEWDEFALTEVTIATSDQMVMAESSGNIYKKFTGQKILDVQIVADSLECVSKWVPVWKYRTDTKVVLLLQNGCISIGRSSLHDQLMVVKFAPSFKAMAMRPVTSYFEDSLEAQYIRSRKILSLKSGREIEDTNAGE